MYLPYCAGVHECSGIELYIVGLSDSGNFLITIVRTLLSMIMNSIMIVGLLVYLLDDIKNLRFKKGNRDRVFGSL